MPDIFFFSVILFFGTFALAFALKKFKLTPYFSAKVRSPDSVAGKPVQQHSFLLRCQFRALLSDYAVILAILVFMGVDMAFGLNTPKLIVPTIFKVC